MIRCRPWLLIALVLLAAHGASARWFIMRYTNRVVITPLGTLTLGLTPDQWAAATAGSDSSCYLRCAKQVAAGNGIVIDVPNSSPPRLGPFFYWGPGAPWVFGGWERLVGAPTMWSFFAFAVVAQLLFGAVALATAALWTRNTLALAAVAVASGVCPPLQDWFYGQHLTSSEIVSLPLWALIFYVLSRGFLAYRVTGAAAAVPRRGWQVWPWFALAGLLIGINSLVRDSSEVFAVFVAVFLCGRALLFDRRRLVVVLTSSALLVGATVVVRRPVRRWNEKRVGQKVVATSSEESIWRFGLWVKHDLCPWYDQAGLGFGQYLDPDAPARVEQYYHDKRPWPVLYSLQQLWHAVARRPGDALAFKISRLPLLWLDTGPGPGIHCGLAAWWCAACYALLIAYLVVRWRRKQPVPEVLYLYLLLVMAATPLIHFEFRYTFPVWNTLVLVPGLLIGAIADARQCRVSGRSLPVAAAAGLSSELSESARKAA